MACTYVRMNSHRTCLERFGRVTQHGESWLHLPNASASPPPPSRQPSLETTTHRKRHHEQLGYRSPFREHSTGACRHERDTEIRADGFFFCPTTKRKGERSCATTTAVVCDGCPTETSGYVNFSACFNPSTQATANHRYMRSAASESSEICRRRKSFACSKAHTTQSRDGKAGPRTPVTASPHASPSPKKRKRKNSGVL